MRPHAKPLSCQAATDRPADMVPPRSSQARCRGAQPRCDSEHHADALWVPETRSSVLSSPPPSTTRPKAQLTAACGPSPSGAGGATTSTPPAATAASASVDRQPPPSTSAASTPDGRTRGCTWTGSRSPTSSKDSRAATRTPRSGSPSSPPGRSSTPSTHQHRCTGRPRRHLVVYLGEGAQLGYLPKPARRQLGW